MAGWLGRVAIFAAHLAALARGQEAGRWLERRWQAEGSESQRLPGLRQQAGPRPGKGLSRAGRYADGPWKPHPDPAVVPQQHKENGAACVVPQQGPPGARGAMEEVRGGHAAKPTAGSTAASTGTWSVCETIYRRRMAAQAGARAELLRVFNHGPQLEADTVDADRAYDQMMVGWMAETDGLDARSVLQRALGAAPSAGAGRDFAGGPMQVEPDHGLLQTFGAPTAPPGLTASAGIPPSATGVHLGGPPLAASTPVAAPISAPAVPEGYTGTVAKDPYMMSPSAHGGPGALPSPSHHYKAMDGSRVSVKTRPQTGPPPTGGQSLGIQAGGAQACAGPFWFGCSCLRAGGHGGCSFRGGDARGDGGPIPVGSGDTSPIAYFCRISGRWCDRRRWRRGRAHLTACTDAPTRVAEPGLSRGLCRLGSPGCLTSMGGNSAAELHLGQGWLNGKTCSGFCDPCLFGARDSECLVQGSVSREMPSCFPVVASLGVLAFSMGAGFSGITVAFTLLLQPSLKLLWNASSTGLRLGSSVAVLMRALSLLGSALSVLPYL